MPPPDQQIESIVAKYPVYQYGFLDINEIVFSDKVRYICETQCKRYHTTWACPPAVGTVESCRTRCLDFQSVLLFSTVSETIDPEYMTGSFCAKKDHETIVQGICHDLQQQNIEHLALSTESCSICEPCTWPEAPCRYPERMMPCIESYGILVVDAAEKCAMDFNCGMDSVVWFGMIFFHRNHL